MPEEGVPLTPKAHLMNAQEVFEIAKIFGILRHNLFTNVTLLILLSKILPLVHVDSKLIWKTIEKLISGLFYAIFEDRDPQN